MANTNECLVKLKLPVMEISRNNDWGDVQVRMEQACTAIEKVTTRDKEFIGLAGKMKKAFRSFCRNAGTGKIFTSLIPDDMCGSVLCGGLNVIFTALEETSFHREAVFKALERLPRILENNIQYTELANQDEEIHRRTAKLYTEAVLTLDHILRWFKMNLIAAGVKRLLNPSAFSSNLNERIIEVNLAAKDLKAHALLFQLGQIRDISTTQRWMSYQGVKMGRQLIQIDQNIRRLADRSASYESIEASMCQNFQSILQGTMQRLVVKNNMIQRITQETTTEEILEELLYDPSLVLDDMQALSRLSLPTAMTPLDVDRVYAVQMSPVVRSWLTIDEDSLLLINGGSDAMDGSTSFAAAQLVRSLLQQPTDHQDAMVILPVAYFCSEHRNYYRDNVASPTELAMSLLLQLIDRYHEFRSKELRECLDRTDPTNIESISTSFRRLVKRLPSTTVVYLVIDGVSFFTMPPERKRGIRDVISHLVNVYHQQSAATLKFLFTSPTRSNFLEDLFEEDQIINIPSTPPPMGSPFLN
ncbi:hypothetical protein F5B20DRAFT_572868 [Whalleya microplaca]|nr:hypothetical protein F5B20DRAFT_572868 [Whalleya microplaca]